MKGSEWEGICIYPGTSLFSIYPIYILLSYIHILTVPSHCYLHIIDGSRFPFVLYILNSDYDEKATTKPETNDSNNNNNNKNNNDNNNNNNNNNTSKPANKNTVVDGTITWPTLNDAITKFLGMVDKNNNFKFREYEAIRGEDEVELPANYKGKIRENGIIEGQVLVPQEITTESDDKSNGKKKKIKKKVYPTFRLQFGGIRTQKEGIDTK